MSVNRALPLLGQGMDDLFCSVSIMGVPQSMARTYLQAEDLAFFRSLRTEVALGPNSLHIKRLDVSKAAPLQWMAMLPR